MPEKNRQQRPGWPNAVTLFPLLSAILLSACIDIEETRWLITSYTVTTQSGQGGNMSPAISSVQHGLRARFTVLTEAGYRIDKVSGCGGKLSGSVYITAPITAECNIVANFSLKSHTVAANRGNGGAIVPTEQTVVHGNTASFTIVPDPGYEIKEVTGCGGTLSFTTYTTTPVTSGCHITARFRRKHHEVNTDADTGGTIDPQRQTVSHGEVARFTVTPDSGYEIEEVTGCDGSLSNGTYTTGPVTTGCAVFASFRRKRYAVTTHAETGGDIIPANITVEHGMAAEFRLRSDEGYHLSTVTGCDGSLSNGVYTTGPIVADCAVVATFNRNPPVTAAMPVLDFMPVKRFRFGWTDVADATFYRLLEDPDGSSGYIPLGDPIPGGVQRFEHYVPLPRRANARYILQSCNEGGCSDSLPVSVDGTLAEAIGYFKAGNTGASDQFGYAIALSGDGNTLAVGAPAEDGSGSGIDSPNDNSATNAGAVYIFTRTREGWIQQAYIKASNTGAGDRFGYALDLSDDGNWLAVGAYLEDSNGAENDNSLTDSGAVYLFVRSGDSWSQEAYLKAGNAGTQDQFGYAVALSGDGLTLAVGAPAEDSIGTGVNSTGNDDSAADSGAVYLFFRSDSGWIQQAYIKAGNTGAGDLFGSAVALSEDGDLLAVGAPEEDSNATGIDNDTGSDTKSNSGAVYLLRRNGNGWNHEAYAKASNTGAGDRFGHALSLSGDGATLAVGAWGENSAARGIDGDESDNSASDSGAVYLFTHDSTGWQQTHYLKSDNSEAGDRFGWSLGLSNDGSLLAVGARLEDSASIGIGGDPLDNSASGAGAVYLFSRKESWDQRSYIKASNTGSGDQFGRALHLSGDGTALAVGGYREDGGATGIDGDANSESKTNSGAVYLY